MDWSIQQVAKRAGTTSRTLRHYDDIGLLRPTRVGHNGYRYYDQHALVRLQRILLLRELGLGLSGIARALENDRNPAGALRAHLQWLQQEKDRIARQIASVERTIGRLGRGDPLMAEHMFDGFDHAQYRRDVERRWGKDAYAAGDRWWRRLGDEGRRAFRRRTAELADAWAEAAARGVHAGGDEAQALARRQYAWLTGVPGTPQRTQGGPTREYFICLGDPYAADLRFAAGYGGFDGARLVRDAMRVYAERNL